jgi:hypothetical protein
MSRESREVCLGLTENTRNAIRELHNRTSNPRGLKSLYTKDANGNTGKKRACTGDGDGARGGGGDHAQLRARRQ